MRKPSLPAALAVLAALGPAPLLAQATTKPSLVVVLSLDGLSWSRLEYYRPWYVAGLKRLLEEGQVETVARYRHLNTETEPGARRARDRRPAAGHRRRRQPLDRAEPRRLDALGRGGAAVGHRRAPGQPPLFYREVEKDGRLYVFALAREFELWERSGETGRASSAGRTARRRDRRLRQRGRDHALQPGARPAAETFPPTTTVTGPGNLRVPTLGDRLVEASPAVRVVVVSGKDRTTVFLAGRDRRHVAYWYDQETGRFVTSSAYDTFGLAARRGAPSSRVSTGRRRGRSCRSGSGRSGSASRPPRLASASAPRRSRPRLGLLDFQLPTNGLGFPHDLRLSERGYFYGVYTSPFVDEVTADLAVDFIADEAFRLGRAGAPDLLAIGFSAQDVVSHSYGNESEENLDTIRRLDLQVGRVFDALERSLPRAPTWSRCQPTTASRSSRRRRRPATPPSPGRRLVNTERAMPTVYERLNRYLSQQLCLPAGSRPVFGGEGWNVAYNRPAFPMRTVEGPCGPADRQVTLAHLDGALPEAVATLFSEEVAAVLLVSQRDRWPADLPAVEFARNDFDAERSGDAFLVPRSGVLMHWDPGAGRTTARTTSTTRTCRWSSGASRSRRAARTGTRRPTTSRRRSPSSWG